jgi:hypothetical protein
VLYGVRAVTDAERADYAHDGRGRLHAVLGADIVGEILRRARARMGAAADLGEFASRGNRYALWSRARVDGADAGQAQPRAETT